MGITDTAERKEVSNCGSNINTGEGTLHCAQDQTGKSILKYLFPIAAGSDISKCSNLQTPHQHCTVRVCHAVLQSRCFWREWVLRHSRARGSQAEGVNGLGKGRGLKPRLVAPGQKVSMGRGRVGVSSPGLWLVAPGRKVSMGQGRVGISSPGLWLVAPRKEYFEMSSKCWADCSWHATFLYRWTIYRQTNCVRQLQKHMQTAMRDRLQVCRVTRWINIAFFCGRFFKSHLKWLLSEM